MTRREMTVYRARGNNEDGQNPRSEERRVGKECRL